jgi:hypothetical protein
MQWGFYKYLFGKELREQVRLDEQFWGEREMVNDEENANLDPQRS